MTVPLKLKRAIFKEMSNKVHMDLLMKKERSKESHIHFKMILYLKNTKLPKHHLHRQPPWRKMTKMRP